VDAKDGRQDVARAVRAYRVAPGPGSWLAISHVTRDFDPDGLG
jgi:hypothetical protein